MLLQQPAALRACIKLWHGAPYRQHWAPFTAMSHTGCISRQPVQVCACVLSQAVRVCRRPWDFHNKGGPLPPCNDQRVATLRATTHVEGPPDPQIDHIVSLICTIFKTEAALVSSCAGGAVLLDCGVEGLYLAAICIL